jgi:hypothetical protein
MPVTEAQEHALSLASVALDENELAAVVKRTLLMNLASQTLCRHYGPKSGCHCKGNIAHCHAHTLWEDEARAIVEGFEQAGAFK